VIDGIEGPGGHRPLLSRESGAASKDPDEVGRQFETLFLTYFVRELKLGESFGLGGESIPGAAVYESFLTTAIAEALSKSGAFGIARAVAEYARTHSGRREGDDDGGGGEGGGPAPARTEVPE